MSNYRISIAGFGNAVTALPKKLAQRMTLKRGIICHQQIGYYAGSTVKNLGRLGLHLHNLPLVCHLTQREKRDTDPVGDLIRFTI